MLYADKLDAVLAEIMRRWGVPGLGVGIVHADKLVYARGFGVQNLETGTPVRPDSLFCLASISKVFAASAVMQLVERGRIHLDAPVVEYLPYFKLDDERYTQITIRQMLSHTAGMPDFDESEYDELVAHPETDEGAAERYVRALRPRKLVAAPGERFWYSNIAYGVLGDLIAKVSGQTFEAYLKEHLLQPAGMSDSTFLLSDLDWDRVAWPHLRTPRMIPNPIYPYTRGDSPASFLHSTAVEMGHWISTCLNQGTYEGRQILTPASFEQMWTPVVKRDNPSTLYAYHGLGWVVGHFEGVRTVSHGGGGFGWTCFLVILPDFERGAIILSNEESSARSRFITAMIRAMLEQEPQAGSVSWMVPITKALEEGGLQAAEACYETLKASESGEYFFHEHELVELIYQLQSAGQLDAAIDLLKLNIKVFPEYGEAYTALARVYRMKGEERLAEETLAQAKQSGVN